LIRRNSSRVSAIEGASPMMQIELSMQDYYLIIHRFRLNNYYIAY